MVKIVENNDLTEAKGEEIAVVDFSATWCGPCQMLAPIIDELSDEMDDVAFYNVDTDANMSLAIEFGVQSIPNVVILKNGKLADRSIGFVQKAQLKQFIEKNI